MLNLTTIEGHKLLVGPDPQGVHFGVIPHSPQLDEGVNDYFTLGLRFTSILQALSEMQNMPGYKTDDGLARLLFGDGKLTLKFRYQHLDSAEFSTGLSPADSQAVIDYLKSLTDGDYSKAFTAITEAEPARPKVGRNDLCPCGSGKTFKKCCGANNAKPPGIPPELKAFEQVEDVFVRELVVGASRDVSALSDPDFWHDLGRMLGTSEQHELAVKAFD